MILNIETTTNVCSVALSKDGKILCEREDRQGRSHASLLSCFIWQILNEKNIAMGDLDAIGVSKGPGSYTGLRIGVSTAKGLCYGSELPLIGIPTLQSLTLGLFSRLKAQGEKFERDPVFIPMLDARRMEVYSAVLNSNSQFIRQVEAEIIDEKSYNQWLEKYQVYFFGSGAEKICTIIKHSNARFILGVEPSARDMIPLTEQKYREEGYEDLAYFEPFYLKDFIATTPKKNIMD